MTTTTLDVFSLDNGLTAIAECVPGSEATAFGFLFPAGSAGDPEGRSGALSVLDEALFRGAGDLDAEAFITRLDGLGVVRSSDVGRDAFLVLGALEAEVFEEALSLFRLALEAPRITEEDAAAARALAISALEGLEDEPATKAMEELARRHLPPPLSRSPYGVREEIESLDAEALQAEAKRRFGPRGAIFAASGPIEPVAARETVEKILGDWSGEALPPPPLGDDPPSAAHRVDAASAQSQITLAARWIPPSDPDEPKALLANEVLSGGMGSRLFTEVREKRGLVYAVRASYSATRGRGDLFAYAGTMPEREEETRKVLEEELRKISEGVTEEEFERARFGVRAKIAMEQESASSRAVRLLASYFRKGRAMTPEERDADFARLSRKSVNDFLERRPFGGFTRLTLGPAKAAVSA